MIALDEGNANVIAMGMGTAVTRFGAKTCNTCQHDVHAFSRHAVRVVLFPAIADSPSEDADTPMEHKRKKFVARPE